MKRFISVVGILSVVGSSFGMSEGVPSQEQAGIQMPKTSFQDLPEDVLGVIGQKISRDDLPEGVLAVIGPQLIRDDFFDFIQNVPKDKQEVVIIAYVNKNPNSQILLTALSKINELESEYKKQVDKKEKIIIAEKIIRVKRVIQAIKKVIEKGSTLRTQINLGGVDHYGWTPLMLALKMKYEKLSKLLVEKNVEVNQLSLTGRTALMLAAKEGYLDIVNALIAAGANVNVSRNRSRAVFKGQEKDNWTALMFAADSGRLDMVDALIAAGASVDVQNRGHSYDDYTDKYGWTALMLAAKEGYLDIVNALIAAGANVNLQNNRRIRY